MKNTAENKDEINIALIKIGKGLRKLREEQGYTSYESFSYDHNLSRMQYWRMEKGQTNLTLKSLLRILKIHDMSLERFFIMISKIK